MNAGAERSVITGLRPTGELTIANHVGAMQPVIRLQADFEGPINLFVADIHGLTDQEPEVVNQQRLDTARTFIAAGADPERTNIYLQTDVEVPTVLLANYLDRLVNMRELLRNPTLKDKFKKETETAEDLAALTEAEYEDRAKSLNVALGRYPILMAADIFVQDATDVPVGEDQYPHVEFARRLARKFNNQYASDENSGLVVPDIMATKDIRIQSLDGRGKMSKSNAKGAILLSDALEDVVRKVRRAKTAGAGDMNATLESHFTLAEELCTNPDELAQLTAIREAHMAGEEVMGDFKNVLADRINTFLVVFQARYREVSVDDVQDILKEGGKKASERANQVLDRTKHAMGVI